MDDESKGERQSADGKHSGEWLFLELIDLQLAVAILSMLYVRLFSSFFSSSALLTINISSSSSLSYFHLFFFFSFFSPEGY